jgi:hypothetical protein
MWPYTDKELRILDDERTPAQPRANVAPQPPQSENSQQEQASAERRRSLIRPALTAH